MSNMSYCRFQNTLSDLEDCQQALEEYASGAAEAPLNRDELHAAVKLITTCAQIAVLMSEELCVAEEELVETLLGPGGETRITNTLRDLCGE